MSEWVKHDGSGPPDLPDGTIVQVRWMDGTEGGPSGAPVEMYDWRWIDVFDDISAYRVIDQNGQSLA